MKLATHTRCLALAVLALIGCADQNPDPVSVGLGDPVDSHLDVTGDAVLDAEIQSDDDSSSSDAVSDRDLEDLLDTGDICIADDECASGLCLFFEAGVDEGICTWFCNDNTNCEDEYDCIYVLNSGIDIAKVCVPEGLCIDHDEDLYGAGPGCLGRDCDDADAARNPGAVETCDGIDNDCDQLIDVMTVDTGQDCDTGRQGACAPGRTYCDANRGALFCTSEQLPLPETCDGIDNDCDGLTDEDEDDEPIEVPCYNGPEGTDGVGECHSGHRVCVEGFFGNCVGQVIPYPEICDNLDNNCKDGIDEGNPEEGVACDTELPGVCATGLTDCSEGDLVCKPVHLPGELAEICNRQDDDCDESVDEDEVGEPLSRVCYYGPEDSLDEDDPDRICRSGIETCDDGLYRECVDQVLPAVEICNGLDDNCNGSVDDEPLDVGSSCETGLDGICAVGVTECLFGLEDPHVCVPLHEPHELTETCNRLDDDCDGSVDEGTDGEPLTEVCYYGAEGTLDETDPVRICRSGTATCDGGYFRFCDGQILPAPETCNRLDDDCNGAVDNTPIDVGLSCGTGLPGVCANGVTQCLDDPEDPLQCVALHEPGELTETCNGSDDDCDGTTDKDDEGEPLTRDCYYGPEGTLDEDDPDRRCRGGTETCADALYGACVGQVLPAVEVCNGIDDDCDGIVDNDPIDAGLGCDTGYDGICASGVSQCVDDPVEPLKCVALHLPGDLPETCNGLDDDCDGPTDEGADSAPLSRACYYGPAGTLNLSDPDRRCLAGTETCADALYGECVGQVLPTVEVCNDVDDDCDGAVDNAPIDVGGSCETGYDGVCAFGVIECHLGLDEPRVCVPLHVPGELTETCNRLDDDCDGATDEDADGDPLTVECYYGPEGTLDPTDIWRICRAGEATCDDGFYRSCVGQVLPAPESCNRLDDDCNGEIDNDTIDEGVACLTDYPGVCSTGITQCVDHPVDPLRCVALYEPGALTEECNGLDDDCDGPTDEGADSAPLSRACYYGPAGTLNPMDPNRRCAAGTETCSGGAFALCDGQLLPIPELCNNIDDNCDGAVDEGDPGADVQCDTGLDGVCGAGVTECNGGTLSCTQIVASGSEVCDGLDNNCNGSADEGNPGADAVCATGQPGICMEGRTSCTEGHLVCNRLREPEESETCNYVDDTCEGNVDEGFQTDGVYFTNERCGNCETNCVTIFNRDEAFGTCDPDGNEETDQPVCVMNCRTGHFDLNRIPGDGCEFDLESDVIYVSKLGHHGDQCGLGPAGTVPAANEPCDTIELGLARASSTSRGSIHVADGQYTETVSIRGGIDLLGGYRSDTWERHLSSTGAIIRGVEAAGHRKAVIAIEITEETVFEGFSIYAANAIGYASNSYAIYIRDSNDQLIIRNNNIIAAMGGPGRDGADGISGAPGDPGDPGMQTTNVSDCTEGNFFTERAGARGTRDCQDPETFAPDVDYDDTPVHGGAGGAPACPNVGIASGSGGNAVDATEDWGGGGSGGYGHYSHSEGGCTVTGGQLEVGRPGWPGEPSTDGIGGIGCLPGEVMGRIVADEWQGYPGLVGEHGAHGKGGGGGGSGGGQWIYNVDTYDISGGGGGGGSGGCAGSRGEFGEMGGGSFGIFIYFRSDPATAANIPTVTDNTIVRNYGGAGGNGGFGGTGGEGGASGMGGRVVAGTYDGPVYCIFDGAGGGAGSRGGHAGGGGGGCGGLSYDIMLFNRNGVDHSSRIYDNSFPLDDGEPTGGIFGAGGNSSNTGTGQGTHGQTGSSGNVGFVD